MIYGLQLLLHIQPKSISMTFLFHKLSKVKIFPSAAVHAKNATLEGTLILQIFFQGKGEPSGMDNV
jgi:hypothetical protein